MEDLNFEYEQYRVFRRLAETILSNLEKYGAEVIAKEINSKSRGEYYVTPTDRGVREFAKKLINKKFN
ncbi:hypothetical protein [Aquimarina sp. RZ0]|uniref:hypothetical protein n=1 Tax=Aquimarina sp. RZ0 TaxID=2607730 RepID=UPI0011F2A68C|nr:hypothetical protein [Aquimarina sp. RZ0]KAA1244556.1 hypothetical protein F0000_16350 [Aquimarina sp. RZ0]